MIKLLTKPTLLAVLASVLPILCNATENTQETTAQASLQPARCNNATPISEQPGCEWDFDNIATVERVRWINSQASNVFGCWAFCHFPGYDAAKEYTDLFDWCWMLMREEEDLRQVTSQDLACRSPCYRPRQNHGDHVPANPEAAEAYKKAVENGWKAYVKCWRDVWDLYGVPKEVYEVFEDPEKGAGRLKKTLEILEAEKYGVDSGLQG
ncbi:hypothetical protein BJ508DRAFT_20025 [Ascobolus immersus RN42]|uniref:Uncharacterized protein n=1 Tax=Ascobolus immersus RN42 TaxID=1160509 RepID=A0A3N4IFK0_ASCIM|nr:hypothetical protein BJ508DRAFT_20025 [Ascobolus immersus RN42]